MAGEKRFSARHTAWNTLNASDMARHDTSEILSGLLENTDRAEQATDIVMGVVRHKLTIDRILRKCATIDSARVKKQHWNLLRMGVYELVFCPNTADYAILNETAELAHKAGSSKNAGFINAVLRNIQRAVESRQIEVTIENKRRVVPQGKSQGCLFKLELLPDFNSQPVQYLQLAYSMPQALVQTWVDAYGIEQATRICIASNRNPSIVLQPNILKNDGHALATTLSSQHAGNVEIKQSSAHTSAISVRGAGKLNRTQAYLEGLFYVQDTTAAFTAELLSPEPGWTIVDLCAAPGGKSAAMAMRMQDKGLILASDIDAERLKRVRQNAKRLGLQSIEIIPAGHIEEIAAKQKRLDAIVLDVPCSNTGVLARRVEARWRWSSVEMASLTSVQDQLLEKAAAMSRSKTHILYSTCSIQPEENELQIGSFLERNRRFMLNKQVLTLPGVETDSAFDHDGGFAALLQAAN